MDYKKKYLKYKKKYLNTKKILKGGMNGDIIGIVAFLAALSIGGIGYKLMSGDKKKTPVKETGTGDEKKAHVKETGTGDEKKAHVKETESVAVAKQQDTFQFTVNTDIEERPVTAIKTSAVHNTIADAFGCRVEDLEEVMFGEEEVESEQTFKQLGIEDGARLNVNFKHKATFEDATNVTGEVHNQSPSFNPNAIQAI